MKHHYYFCKKYAFTLAEVLITLGIIGIVAALTLSHFIDTFQKKQTVSILQRAYSDLNQYIKAFDYENECNGNFANCAPGEQEFIKKFQNYLCEKQKFKRPPDPQGRFFDIYAKYNSTSETTWYARLYISRVTTYLISPTGQYAYIISYYPYDNYYVATINGKKEYFRGRIYILTNTNTEKNQAAATTQLQFGKNVFGLSVTQLERLLPHGSPLCPNDGNGYYCQPLKADDCTKESGNYERCFQKIINDGWEIKYSY